MDSKGDGTCPNSRKKMLRKAFFFVKQMEEKGLIRHKQECQIMQRGPELGETV